MCAHLSIIQLFLRILQKTEKLFSEQKAWQHLAIAMKLKLRFATLIYIYKQPILKYSNPTVQRPKTQLECLKCIIKKFFFQ